jgi:hypothetical protein
MFERMIRGFAAGLKGEILVWIILLVLSGIIYLIRSL